jgi:hypothetical protein
LKDSNLGIYNEETYRFGGSMGQRDKAMYPTNLYADLNKVTSVSISDLREANKVQKLKELDLIAGTRYFEIVDSYFGVKSILGLLDYPEHISSSTHELTIAQVVQTSIGAGETPQGNIAGYTVKGNQANGINFTAKEHGHMISIVYITQKHTYQQGLHKMFKRKTKYDYFMPDLIGLGFQPIMQHEIYGTQTDAERQNIFAYAPSYEIYRRNINTVTGQLNVNSRDTSGNPNSLSN